MNEQLLKLCVFLLLLLVSFALYATSLTSYFVADDHLWREVNTLEEILSFFYSSWGHGTAYRPLVRLSLSLNAFISVSDPFYWHVVNVVIHTINAFLVYCISKKILHFGYQGFSKFYINIFSVSTALLFVTSRSVFMNVGWISARTHSLGTLFFLLAFFCLLTSKQYRYYYAGVLFVAAMMCYESMAIFPFFLLPLLWLKIYLQEHSLKKLFVYRKEYLVLLIYFLVLIAFLLMRHHFLGIYTVKVSPFADGVSSIIRNILIWPSFIYGHTKWLKLILIVLFVSLFFVNGKVKFNLKLLISSVFLIGAAFAIIVPYILSAGFGYRYTYLAMVFVCIVAPILLIEVVKSSRKFLLLIPVYIFLSSVYDFNKTTGYVYRTTSAADLAYQVLESSTLVIEKLPENKELFFLGVPSYTTAFVHMTYFDLAMKHYYNQLNNSSSIIWDSLILTVPLVLRNVDKNDYFYIYRNNKMQQVSMQQWLSSDEYNKLNLPLE